MTPNITAIAVLSAAAAASFGTTEVNRPAPTGPYGIGRQNVVWTDSSRRDPTDSTRLREVSVWIWYPSDARNVPGTESPLPAEWQSRRLETLRTKLGSDIANAMKDFAVRAQTDAPLLAGSARLPVLLFTPGLSWLATDYSVLLEDLASHGYVIVGFSPAGFSNPVMFPDGRVIGQSLANGANIGTDQAFIHDDAAFVLSNVPALDRYGFFKDRIDLARIGAFGHSIGGVAALVLAARDTSVRAAVNLDGDVMGNARDVRPHQPILFINSDVPSAVELPTGWPQKRVELFQDGLVRSEQRRTGEWANTSSESSSAHRLRILGTRHLNFTDAALASTAASSPEATWMKFGSIHPGRALSITAELVRAFFDQVFARADAGDLFSAPGRRFPEVHVE